MNPGERLAALADRLGETPADVARTLRAELERALAEIDAGLVAGDAEAIARATHAARNSVLMLDERPMLATLRALEAATREDEADADGARAAREALGGQWARLARELAAVR